MVKITKNFLDKDYFNEIYNVVSSNSFSWYYNNIFEKTRPEINNDYNFQLTHTLYSKGNTNSQFFNLFQPLIDLIDPFLLVKLKINLNPKTHTNIEHGMHTDFNEKDKNITSGLLYLNTNNGYTRFETGEKIQSVENTFIEFDNNINHTGATCTDTYRRLVMNINYIKR
jgi:hypothetical protein